MKYLGNYAEDATVYVYFTTSDGSGGAVAPSDAFEAADVGIYKDGSATQKVTTNGLTMTSPFDTVTGLHALAIDTSNDTGDAGFWATGSDYTVVLNPIGSPSAETVDGQTVVAVLATFAIENRHNEVLLANGAHGGAAATITAKSIAVTATDTNASAVTLTGDGTGHGLYCVAGGGNSSCGILGHHAGSGLAGIGIKGLSEGGAQSCGMQALMSGSTSGWGFSIRGTGGNAPGLECRGDGSGAGIVAQGDTTGGTGPGMEIAGGATSGDGIDISVTSGTLIDYGGTALQTVIVDEFETQSQADPTGFHVNVKEVNDLAQTANDNGLDINTLITQVGTAGDGLTALPWNAAWDAEVQSEVTDALSATLTEDYPADTGDASVLQMLYAMMQFLVEKGFAGTTGTIKKRDGSTTAYTVTINSASTPTQINGYNKP